MHPAIAQAATAERIRDQHVRAAARQRVAEIRRSRTARRSWPFIGVRPAGPGREAPRAARLLRAPRAA
jgi:hypothetical protein